MKVFPERQMIELSRRNLLSLLAKLDGHPPNSACTITTPISDGVPLWSVHAVEDAEHYSDRPAGPMIAETERMLPYDQRMAAIPKRTPFSTSAYEGQS